MYSFPFAAADTLSSSRSREGERDVILCGVRVCVFINVAQKHSLCVMVCGSFNEEI